MDHIGRFNGTIPHPLLMKSKYPVEEHQVLAKFVDGWSFKVLVDKKTFPLPEWKGGSISVPYIIDYAHGEVRRVDYHFGNLDELENMLLPRSLNFD